MGEAKWYQAGPLVLRTAVAFVQGVFIWWLYDGVEYGRWPADEQGWFIGLVAASVTVPLAHYLLEGLASLRRQWPALAAFALLALGLGWHAGAWARNPGGYDGIPAFPLAFAVLVFHALPFVQSGLTGGALRPRYEELFRFAWRNALLLALGGVFVGVFWLLLWLWGALFHMLEIDVFRDLFLTSAFAIPATAVAAGAGIQLAGSVEQLQTALRQQLLAMLKWLAPLVALILALFTVALVVKSPDLFAEQRRAISAAWLLWLVAMTVALLNAAYQDGRIAAPYPRLLGAAVRYASTLLLPVALLALYAIAVRIDAYGLTVERAWAVLVAAIALAYAGGYAAVALRRGPWMAGIGTVNVAVALFTMVALVVMLTPLLSPERLAAASQSARILANPDADAFGSLRFDSGRYGRDRLAGLSRLQGHPLAEDIRTAAARELRKTSRWGRTPDKRLLAVRDFAVFPDGAPLDPTLLAALNEPRAPRAFEGCTGANPCPILFADLDGDATPEAIMFTDGGAVGVAGGTTGWKTMQQLLPGRSSECWNVEAIRRALEAGDYRLVPFPLKVIEIDGRQLLLAPPQARAPPGRRCGAEAGFRVRPSATGGP
jgi:hypothetical protein